MHFARAERIRDVYSLRETHFKTFTNVRIDCSHFCPTKIIQLSNDSRASLPRTTRMKCFDDVVVIRALCGLHSLLSCCSQQNIVKFRSAASCVDKCVLRCTTRSALGGRLAREGQSCLRRGECRN